MVCGSEPRRGNPDTRTYRVLNHRATPRLYLHFSLHHFQGEFVPASCIVDPENWTTG